MASLVDLKPTTFGSLALASSALKYASSSESELNKNSQVMISSHHPSQPFHFFLIFLESIFSYAQTVLFQIEVFRFD